MGQSGRNVGKRSNHFTAGSGSRSPRRSLGALLKSKLGLKVEPSGEKYRFADNGEACLSAWMRRNLRCAIYPFNGDRRTLEKRLIEENKPPLNLTGWPNPYKEEIEELRKQCREEAKRTLSGSA